MHIKIIMSALALAATALPVHGETRWTSDRPDGHAPMGVMADHAHSAGEWMLAYQFTRMQMSRLRDGSERISTAEALDDFNAAPTDMDMDMHMLMLMYAPTDRLTLMVMGHYMDNTMDMAMSGGMTGTMETSGIGDTFVGGIYKMIDADRQQVLLNFGVSLPTGSTDEDVDMMGGMRAGYPMQLGSGTLDLRPGLTWLGQSDQWSWGAQTMATVRTGENSEDYTLGDELMLTAWGARRVNEWLSLSLRVEQHQFSNVDGADPEMNPAASPVTAPGNQGGERTSLGLGANVHLQGDALAGHRVGMEFLRPVRERLDGPQMAGNYIFTLAWEYAF